MKQILHLLYITISFIFLGCNQSVDINVQDYIDHWEIIKTYESYANSKFEIDTIKNDYKIVKGANQILIITKVNNPVFKKGKKLEDLHSKETILLELNAEDSLITPKGKSKSKILRKLIALYPDYGIKPLRSDEVYRIERIDSTKWSINLDLYDLKYKNTVDFSTTEKLDKYYK